MNDSVIDLRPFLDAVPRCIDRHQLGGVGAYTRWSRNDRSVERERGLKPYGCADAPNLLYTIGSFPEPAQHQEWIARLQSLQDSQTGLFYESTHHPLHCTAHVMGALQLFAARPLHPLRALAQLRERTQLIEFLEQLDW